MIMAIDYLVNSTNTTIFRICSTKGLKECMIKVFTIDE